MPEAQPDVVGPDGPEFPPQEEEKPESAVPEVLFPEEKENDTSTSVEETH
jgi:hypothetical protein